jgi:hypothetical protein
MARREEQWRAHGEAAHRYFLREHAPEIALGRYRRLFEAMV